MFNYIREKPQAIRFYYREEKYEELDDLLYSMLSKTRDDKNYELAYKYLTQRANLHKIINKIPVLGFNSGRYDMNLIKNDLFAVLDPSEINSVIWNPNCMCISTPDYKILDISNYLPVGTFYDSYLKTNLGECKCADKIQCVCGLGKSIFCYEYITSFDKLNEVGLLPREAFDSKFKGTKISDDDYERVKFVWSHYNMKTVKDLLIWYNNLDVQPFVRAVNEQRKLYKKFGLDMFSDDVSLPSLSEKVMCQTCYNNLEQSIKPAADPFEFPLDRSNGYKSQDAKANRDFALTIDHVNKKLKD